MNKRVLINTLLGLLAIGLLTSCKADPTLATLQTSGISVGITDDSCPNVIVRVGEQIMWTNQGQEKHLVRAIPLVGLVLFDSGEMDPGDSFTFTFTEPISYTYVCSENATDKGLVTVER
jgi:plastocyanin